ncbi:MAG: hypothetical protein KatS3mg105_5076 [Gemmatales bacterium]|nr:MAG: hypothetical protein KatS3mg105_5076 [Gemmatales bacterium]
MIFGWLKERRRRRILSSPFPDQWNRLIEQNVAHARQLTDEQRKKLRRLVQVFVAEKNWEGCRGLTLTDEMKVTIAAQACLLVVGMTDDIHFDHVLSILVYPHAYIAPETRIGRAGVVVENGQARLGEAWYRGPVVLSWEDTLAGGRMETPGHNLVLHEFAHQLDMMNGRVSDGTPLLETNEQCERWASVLEPEYRKLVEDCQTGHRGFIDCYGATNEAEFFAVLTESFFERPRPLKAHHADVYDLLRDFYRLDPTGWL